MRSDSRFDIFSPDWGMLRRSGCVQTTSTTIYTTYNFSHHAGRPKNKYYIESRCTSIWAMNKGSRLYSNMIIEGIKFIIVVTMKYICTIYVISIHFIYRSRRKVLVASIMGIQVV